MRAARAAVELDWHADPRPLISAIDWILAQDVREAPNIAPSGLRGSLSERDFDAGRVDRGTEIEHTFTVKNTGAGDLTVDAKPGCGWISFVIWR